MGEIILSPKYKVRRARNEYFPIYLLGSVENTLNTKQYLQSMLLQWLLALTELPYRLLIVIISGFLILNVKYYIYLFLYKFWTC